MRPRDPRAARGADFRSDLEGLRAVAVLLVLLYHAGVPGISGGYVGVDVFFVLSGYLITGLLIRELGATGRISLANFYARRARRLLPASALVLVVTAIASAIVMPPLRMPDVAADIAAAAAYVSNLRFAFLATDYLGSELAVSPVLHFWSLGVEEQFYLFWPAAIGLLVGPAFLAGDAARGLRRLGILLVAVVVGSLGLSLWLTQVQQPWAFFSLPTRAWELALGGLIAHPAFSRLVPARAGPWLGWFGLALVVYSGVAFDSGTTFPGTAALVPTIGAALVIVAGLPSLAVVRARWQLPGPGAMLSRAPLRFFGRISYSLYLWHWPLLVLPAVAFGDLRLIERAVLVALAVLLAWASTTFLEDPIRHGRFVGVRPSRNLALAGVTTVSVVAIALGIGTWTQRTLQPLGPAIGGSIDEVPLPTVTPSSEASQPPASTEPTIPQLATAPVPADLVPALPVARDDLPVIYSDGCHLDPATVTPGECVFGNPEAASTVMLFGDSHAAQWFPAVDRLAAEHDWRLVSLTKSACASADVPVWSGLYDRPYDECQAWREEVFQRIEAERPSLVVISNARRYTLTVDNKVVYSTDREDLWDAGLQATIARIRAAGSEVLLIGDTVRMREDPPVCLSENLGDIAQCASPWSTAVATERLARDRAISTAAGAHFIDPTPWMCFTEPCPPVIGRFLVYRDTHHMTATYARALAEPLWDKMPRELLVAGRP